MLVRRSAKREGGHVSAMPAFGVKWPFQFVVDSRGASVGWVVVHSRVTSPERLDQLADLRRAGFRFVGMSSDGTFPLSAASDPIDYGALCEAWCHCFRRPDDYLPANLPRTLLSDSDFTDWLHVRRQADAAGTATDTFDVMYAGATEDWKREAKNWDLARSCLPRLCNDLDLRIAAVGIPEPAGALAPFDKSSGRPEQRRGAGVRRIPSLPWAQFLACLRRSRILFVPNELDASPRVIAEALCLDVPVLVNRRILGGWKYVNPFTGVFFDGEHDVVSAARDCLAADRRPSAWFRSHHGPYLAGWRLLALLRSVDRSITERSHLALAERAGGPPSAAQR